MAWKTLSSKTIFENAWMSVHEDRVRNPRGSQNDYGWMHFKNQAIAIVPLDRQQYTWLVGQDRYTLGEYSWELPMGGGALDRDPLESAKRELAEETGLTANRWTELMRLHPSNSITDEKAVVYLAEDLSSGPDDPDETEVLAVRHLPLTEAIEMAMNGQITDAISVAALLRMAIQ